jgi:hypothetical protein
VISEDPAAGFPSDVLQAASAGSSNSASITIISFFISNTPSALCFKIVFTHIAT